MSIYPKQKVSSAERNKVNHNGKTWWEQNGDYHIEQSISGDDYEELYRLARICDDEIDEKSYNYVLNPFNTDIEKYKRFGAKLRNYNIINPVKDLYTGEFGGRFKNIQVLSSNPNDDTKYNKQLNELTKRWWAQEAVNILNENGIQTNQESVKQKPLEQAQEEFTRKYKQNRVITGQEALDYIKFDQDLDEKYIQMYDDFLTYGRCISYKGVSNDDVDFEVVDPLTFRFPKLHSFTFIEDLPWAVRRLVMPVNWILDRFNGKLTDECINWLDEQARENEFSTQGTGFVQLPSAWISNKEDYNKYSLHYQNSRDGVELHHVVWKSFKKIGTLTYINEIGMQLEMEVDDTYKLNKAIGDISIKWEWESVVCEIWRIGEKFYVDGRELPYNRSELNNKGAQKIPYNGRYMITKDGKVKSVVKSGEPYQILYNIFHYQWERIMNKNKDKLAILPLGLMPSGKNGWDEEKSMYYAHANSYMFIDETKPTAGLALQGIKVLDMGLGTYAKDMIQFIQSIKQEWWESIGMNRQRFGDVNSSDGKGVNEQAIYRSALITEEFNRKFEKFQEKDYAGLLDISKFAWINGKKGMYINSEGKELFINMNQDDAIFHLESDYDVFVKNSRIENEKLDALKSFAFAYAQNGNNAEAWLEMLDTTNFTKAKEIISKGEAIRQKLEQDNLQADRENLKNIEDAKRNSEAEEREMRKYEADKKYDAVIDAKILELENEDGTEEIDLANEKDRKMSIEEAKYRHTVEVDNKKLQQGDREVRVKERLAKTAEDNVVVNRIKAKTSNNKSK